MERKRDMKKQTEWSRAYNEKAYDRLYIVVPKGQKAKIQAQAKRCGLSLNEYIKKMIDFNLLAEEDDAEQPARQE